jgi:tetratricopeptide (TPR) repeat protein
MMKSKLSLALSCMVSIMLLTPPAVHAQMSLVQSYSNEASKAFLEGRINDAEKLYKECVQLCRNAGPGNEGDLANYLIAVANIHMYQYRYTDADAAYQEALKLIESGRAPASKQSLDLVLGNLGISMEAQGRYAQAAALYKQALDLAESKYGRGSQSTSVELNRLAMLKIKVGSYHEATDLLERFMPLFRNPNSFNTWMATTAVTAGTLAQERGLFAHAETQFGSAVQILEQLTPFDHRSIGLDVALLGELHTKQGKYDDAERELKKALALIEQSKGPLNRLDTGKILTALAANYVAAGKYSEAKPTCERALTALEGSLGANNIETTNVLTVMAQIHEQNGNYAEAEKILSNCLKLRESVLGSAHPKVRSTLRDLGVLAYEQGDNALAESWYRKALAIDDVSAGGRHPDIPEINAALARCLVKQQRYDDAAAAYNKVLADLQIIFGKDTWQYADALRELASVHLAQRNFTAAEAELQQVVAIDKAQSPPAKLAADYDLLAKAYSGLNNAAAAKEAIAKAQDLKKQLPGAQFVSQLAAASTSAATKPPAPAGVNAPIADKWAVVIGISNFKDPSINLKYATKDAIDFKNFLVKNARFQPDHVRLLTDTQATRDNIIGQLGDRWLGRLANRDDLVVIYISSHGSSAQQAANGVNFLVAHDTRKDSLLATGIPMQWLTNIIKDQVHSDRVVMILDVCHGGSATESKGLLRANGVDLDGLALGKGQAVLCSSIADQLSWESKTYQNSVFTRRLIESLGVNGEKTTLQAAYKHLRDAVESEVLRDRGQLQTPVLNEKLWVGSDAMLSVKPTKPRPGLGN